MFPRSQFAASVANDCGIVELMEDLGSALASGEPDMVMMGGGNPARIPEVERLWSQAITALAQSPDVLGPMLGNYDPPSGNPGFRSELAGFLRRACGWEVGPENIAVTPGGQTAFFFLLNLFGGRRSDGGGPPRKILLPLAPEYIGYAGQGLEPDFFVSCPGKIKLTRPNRFKYHIDFDRLQITPDIGAICLSRPTNPSANVVTRKELERLATLAETHGIPLLLDNAYGLPFPGVVYTKAEPFWHPSVIQTLSLSKLGLPGTRTGFVVGPPEIIREISALNAVVGLANNNLGQFLAKSLLQSGELERIGRDVIRPYYRRRCLETLALLDRELEGLPYRVHEPEGAFFLWLWLEGCPLSSRELYLGLKERGVIVVPGNYFFYGMPGDWTHQKECLRLSYTQPPEILEKGIKALGAWLRTLAFPPRRKRTQRSAGSGDKTSAG
ncbi:MAG: valine--pyruvate aminotransferase [Verrucomicrobia bacterium]|nr:MAG: valine--pyruvate aminotransferase [Verrucomicrobiota bacterium]